MTSATFDAGPGAAGFSRFTGRVQSAGIVIAGLMVWAGQVKQIPMLSNLPVDFTLATTGLALMAGAVFMFSSGTSIPRDPLIVVVALLCCGVFGAVNYVASDYAADKTLRYFLLTWMSSLAIAMLIRDQEDTRRFIRAALSVALGLSVFIALGGEREYNEDLGRLMTTEGDTILFGQACGAVAIATVAWLLTSDRLTLPKLAAAAALLGFEIWTMLAIASKGPVQALVLGSIVIVALQLRRLNPRIATRVVGITIVSLIALAAVWSRVPLWSRNRILEFASGASAGSRFRAWSYSWDNLDASPFGSGWGSWDAESPVRIGHPHNILLELWYETGLLGLGALLLAIGVAVSRLLALYEVDRKLATLGLAVASFFVFAAQVSSDVNGNKLLFGMLVATAAPIAWSRFDGGHDDATEEPAQAAVGVLEPEMAVEEPLVR